MALSLARKAPRGTVGLDIDGGFLAAVGLSSGRIETAVSADLEPDIITDGEVTDVPALSSAL